MISIRTVTRRFGRAVAVDGVSLEIASGDSVALWGANGAGKTTLLRCVLGLLRFRGAISVDGCDVRSDGKRARLRIGYVPQELGFHDDLGVAEAVRFFARLKGVALGSTEPTLERVGLPGQGRKRIRELSGGMKQRLALAIAMLGDPPVLVLDEVTASLDACGREEFVTLLKRLSGSGRTMLFASHRIDEVTTLAKRALLLERGKAVGTLSGEELMHRLGAGSTLHLTIRREGVDRAIAALLDRGFQPRRNGVGIFVPVPGEQKAAPFRILAEAGIAIDDFEVIAGGAPTDRGAMSAGGAA